MMETTQLTTLSSFALFSCKTNNSDFNKYLSKFNFNQSIKKILWSFLLFIPMAGLSQVSSTDRFRAEIEKYNLTFSPPAGFMPIEGQSRLLKTSSTGSVLADYCFGTAQGEFTVVVDFQDLRNQKFINNLSVFKSLTHNGNYQKAGGTFKPHNKTEFYPDSFSKTRFGADVAGYCAFELNEPFNGKYTFCIQHFIQRNNMATVSMYFLFKEYNEEKMGEILTNYSISLAFKQ